MKKSLGNDLPGQTVIGGYVIAFSARVRVQGGSFNPPRARLNKGSNNE